MSKPHGPGSTAAANGPRQREGPVGTREHPRAIKLKPVTLEQRQNRMRALREIHAREAANHAYKHSLNTGTDADHFAARRAEGRVKAEVSMNQRYKNAKRG